MSVPKRKWSEYPNEEKMLVIESYLEGVKNLDSADAETQNARLQWLREHLPAYRPEDGKNYVFISYSHRDFAKVYHDLAAFSYNADKKVRFWYDEGLPAGKNWAEEVKKYIEQPNCVGAIFYLSENLLSSEAVLQEIEMIKKTGKPYVAVALDKEKFSTLRILEGKENQSNFDMLNDFFPDADTALIYGEEYENILYRIRKIEDAFNVTEDVLSDFVCEETDGGLKLVQYAGNNTEVFIPEKINGRQIVAIQAEFPQAVSIYIPWTVALIEPFCLEMKGEWADRRGVKDYAPFGDAKYLKQIDVDKSNPYFYSADGILFGADGELLRVPQAKNLPDDYIEDEGITKIGEGALYGCYVSNEQTLSNAVTKIGASAFAYSRIYGVTVIAGQMKKIGASAFAYATLEPCIVQIAGEIEKLEPYVFFHTKGLGIVTLPNTLKTVGRSAFEDSTVIRLVMRDGVETVEDCAFASCDKMQYLRLSKTLTEIGDNAFYGCMKLKALHLPASLKKIGTSAFGGCEMLTEIRYEGTRRQWRKVKKGKYCFPDKVMKYIVCRNDYWRRFCCWWRNRKRDKNERQVERFTDENG